MPAKRASNRRQFLTGRSAADALADLADSSAAESDRWRADPAAQPYLVQLGRRAMACQFEALVNAGQYPHGGEAVLEALDLIDQLETQLTVYRDTSEISHVNREAAQRSVVVEPRLFALLKRAAELHRDTGGAFDITAGPLTKLWGFYRRAGAIPTADDLADALAHVGSEYLELNDTARSVRFLATGMELNLGAIGKGYALDRAAEVLQAAGMRDFLWQGGQSSVLARGSRSSAAASHAGWMVGVAHPLRPKRLLAEILLRDRALGTSGSGTQFFRHQGRRYGHILDPRSGQPAEGVFSATVVARTAADADALATACYTMGPQRALEYCQTRPEIGLLMLVPGTGARAVELVTSGLADEDWRPVGE